MKVFELFKTKKVLFVFLFCKIIILQNSFAQLKDDYKRANLFTFNNICKNIYNLNLHSSYFLDSSGVMFVNYEPEQVTFEMVNFNKMKIEQLFDHNRVADTLSKILNYSVNSKYLLIQNIICYNQDSFLLKINNLDYSFNKRNYEIRINTKETLKDSAENGVKSPDGKWIAFVQNYNLFIKSTKDKNEIIQLSHDGTKDNFVGSFVGYGDLIKAEDAKLPEHLYLIWSPDSKKILTCISDINKVKKMYLIDYKGMESYSRPDLYSYYRSLPGEQIVNYKIVCYSLENQVPPIILDSTTNISYVQKELTVRNQVLIINKDRSNKKDLFKVFDYGTQKIEILFSEESKTYLSGDYDIQVLNGGRQFVFISERTGWQQLFLYDLIKKKVYPITTGNFRVDKIIHIDEKKGIVYFLASGKEVNENPYFQNLYMVRINGGQIKRLSKGDGFHKIQFSPDYKYFIDEVSSPSSPPVFSLNKTFDNSFSLQLCHTNIDRLKQTKWTLPDIFECIGRDGKTKVYGTLWKPTNFDLNKKYPIIDLSYTGPQEIKFTRTFLDVIITGQELAELGFIVMKMDGMGMNGRSKAFQDVSYKNFDNALVEHVQSIRYLASKYSWIDTSKVGILGYSAGGYDAVHALLKYPNFYKVGISISGNHDFTSEGHWWLEKYFGYPVDSTYKLFSNTNLVNNLKGHLLLMHGGLDYVVNPSSTYKLVENLINANKKFDMMIFPSRKHNYDGYSLNYKDKLIWNYFVQHLRGEEPIWSETEFVEIDIDPNQNKLLTGEWNVFYENQILKIEIFIKEGKLFRRNNGYNDDIELKPFESFGYFYNDNSGRVIKFIKDENGGINKATLNIENKDYIVKRVD